MIRRSVLGAIRPNFVAVAEEDGFSITWTDVASSTTSGTEIDYGTCDIGAESDNRVVAVGIYWRVTNNNDVVSAVSIGGVSATQVSGALGGGGLTNRHTDVWQAEGVTGTTANITVTYSAAASRSAIEVFRVITTTPTPSDSENNSTTTATNIADTLTIPAGGGAIAIIQMATSPTSVGWTNATEADAGALVYNLGTFDTVDAAINTSDSGNVTITATGSGGTSPYSTLTMSLVAWGP